eukprot:Phypoly_transcript_24235.p1 GENE.Phypoly_transcript_24235~~Phypoly_transcript_24235.p1  ORF type:complete len:173 (+),score=12.61 Phypoly_transcript_24235:8-526(+)
MNANMTPGVLCHVFCWLSGCELVLAGATCHLWYSISIDDLFWKYLFALYIGKNLLDKPINLEQGQWKKIFIDCFGSCDVGYTSANRFWGALDTGKQKWGPLTPRNRISHIWQNRFLPAAYESLRVYYNTTLFGDFPLWFNFLSHTIREGHVSTVAKGILFNKNCPFSKTTKY